MIDVVDKERQALDPSLSEIIDEEEKAEGGYVYCATCSHVVGRSSDGIEVNDAHQHTFVNPYGVQFHLACYREALGCAISGERTAADSWFPGFGWQYAWCAECKQHLGWLFDKTDAYFYGLITDRIQND
jgi:hypothetical protein